jgi:uncharacterized protein YjbJ (UPF0337 family)
MCAGRPTPEAISPTLGLQKSARTLEEGKAMNWERIEGNWKQFKGNVKEQWAKLTDDQLEVIAGKRDQLAGKIEETYGITKEQTEKQLAEWQNRQTDKNLKEIQ